METDLQTASQDVVLPHACLACGGPITVRLTQRSAYGACLRCHLVTALGVSRDEEGVHVGHLAAAAA